MIPISDHALVRFLERSGALDVEQLRSVLATSLERGCKAAARAGIADYVILVDGLKYVVVDDKLVTVLGEDMRVRRRPGQRR